MKLGWGQRGYFRWTRGGQQISSCGFYTDVMDTSASITFNYAYDGVWQPDVKVNLSWYSPGFGGRRYFFECPLCGRRMRTLHFWFGKIACRLCHDLTYESCNESNRYNSLFKSKAAGTNASWQEMRRVMSEWARESRRKPKRPRGRPRKTVS